MRAGTSSFHLFTSGRAGLQYGQEPYHTAASSLRNTCIARPGKKSMSFSAISFVGVGRLEAGEGDCTSRQPRPAWLLFSALKDALHGRWRLQSLPTVWGSDCCVLLITTFDSFSSFLYYLSAAESGHVICVFGGSRGPKGPRQIQETLEGGGKRPDCFPCIGRPATRHRCLYGGGSRGT